MSQVANRFIAELLNCWNSAELSSNFYYKETDEFTLNMTARSIITAITTAVLQSYKYLGLLTGCDGLF